MLEAGRASRACNCSWRPLKLADTFGRQAWFSMAALGYTAKPSQSVGPLCTAGTTATALTHTCSNKQSLLLSWRLIPVRRRVDSVSVHGICMAKGVVCLRD